MNFSVKTLVLLGLLFSLSACFRGQPSENPPIHPNPNMYSQPKYDAQEESNFFIDRSAMRMPVPGTVALSELREDEAYYKGKTPEGNLILTIPIEVTLEMLQRGKERFNIYCSPCHGLAGFGDGIIIKKGFLTPPSFHIQRLREAPDGHFFDVITNGIRNMPKYDHQVPVKDRWAIVAYIRALQKSQNARIQDIPKEEKDQIN